MFYRFESFRNVKAKRDVGRSTEHNIKEEVAIVKALEFLERYPECGCVGVGVYLGESELVATLTLEVEARECYILFEQFKDTRFQTLWMFYYVDELEAFEAACKRFAYGEQYLKAVGVLRYVSGRKVYSQQATIEQLYASYELLATVS